MNVLFKIIVIMIAAQTNVYAQSTFHYPVPKDTFHIQSTILYGTMYSDKIDSNFYSPLTNYLVNQIATSSIDSSFLNKYSYHWILYYDFYSTLTALHNINSLESTEFNNIAYYYNIDIKSKLKLLGFNWDFYTFNEYGFKYFIDSITTKTQDQLTFKNSLFFPILNQKINASLSASTQTKLFNTYQYRTNANQQKERYLYDAFMSPGIIFYAAGITYQAPHDMILQLGLGTSKVTRINNQKIFESRNTETINGLLKGTKKKSEFGITFSATIPLQHLSKHLHWECYTNIFTPMKSLNHINSYTADLNNVFHIVLLKYVRISWRTKFSFNAEQNPKPVLINQLSLGFYLNNHL